MKKFQLSSIFLATSLLLTSTTVFAYQNAGMYKGDFGPQRTYKGEKPSCASACNDKALHSGFYVGIAGGYDSYRINDNISTSDESGDTFGLSPVINATGFVGGAFIGFGRYIYDIYYLGAELFGNYSNAITSYKMVASDPSLPSDTYYSQVTVRGSYGAALHPGIKLNDSSLLYGIAGFSRASIRTSESIAETDGTAASTNKWKNGFNYGLGIETALAENLSLRGEYKHVQYGTVTTPFATRLNPSDNQFMLGLLYHFG